MTDELPDWRDVYDERHAPSGWWGEPRASESRATVEREAQRDQWAKAEAAHKAERRRKRGRRTRNPIAKALGYRVREVMQADDDQGRASG